MNSSNSTTTIPLRDWIRNVSSSNINVNKYLTSTVNVALLLTERVSQIQKDKASSEAVPEFLKDLFPFSERYVRLEDIIADNVVVSVVTADGTTDAVSDVDISLSGGNNRQNQQPFSERSACHALGEILLELFSRGQSRSRVFPRQRANDHHRQQEGDFAQLNLGDGDILVIPPSRKKQQLGTNDATGVKDFLLSIGLPLSVCHLVSDLIDSDSAGDFVSDTTIQSLEEAEFDLIRMKNLPDRFLFDRTLAQKALDDSELFKTADIGVNLFGRGVEMDSLREAANRVLNHMNNHNQGRGDGHQHQGVLCEAVFLSGIAGSGKSSLIRHLLTSLSGSAMFVVNCKFDRQVTPLLSVSDQLVWFGCLEFVLS